jgi:uncharacterized protein YjbI with pentapeptide repeats
MRVINRTRLIAAPLVGRIGFPGHSLTLVVKGLFRLSPGQVTELLEGEKLAFPTGDIPLDGEDEERPELRYASDFAYYKPYADLMLVGTCHPPGGEAVTSCPVGFGVGSHSRSLVVFGDRWWSGGELGPSMTAPQPFVEMPLTWGRAYGGAGSPDNPAGRGARAVELADGRAVWPLPNIEAPEQRVASPNDRPAPAAFAPLPLEWEPRRSKAGTYKGEWLEKGWPWFPDDLDWSLFNAAPPPLQAPDFLNGDEEVFLENIHPEHSRFRTRLPGLRVRCFLHELPAGVEPPPPTRKAREGWTPPPREAMVLREVPLNLDTLWIDADAGLLALVWRGHGPVRDADHAEVRDLFVIAERVEDPPAELDACRAALYSLMDEADDAGVDSVNAVDTGADGAEPADETQSPGEAEADTDEANVEPDDDSMAKLRAQLEAAGIDPDDPPEPTAEDREKTRDFLREHGFHDIAALLDQDLDAPEAEPEPPPPAWTRERVAERYALDRDLRGADLRRLDLSRMTLAEADLEGANLDEASLTETDLSGATLFEATLRGSRLENANLGGARLTRCDLDRANLRGASLVEADATGARMRGVDLSGSDLTDAVLDGAQLGQADLRDARGDGASLVGADLTEAVLRNASFEGAAFTDSVLDRADAGEAVFASADFDGVRAVGASFMGGILTGLRAADALDFTGANLSLVKAAESVWSGATLARANLAWAVLDGADFSGADLEGADLYAAHLRGARFGKAVLVDARLAAADAFEANFEKADLARADLRGGNFYGAEFLDARFYETATEGANLRMTKYA